MKAAGFILIAFCLPILALGQAAAPASSPKILPKPDFILHYGGQKEEGPGLVLGPMKTENGKTTGSFAVYGGPSLAQVTGLSFSGDGKLLAVGSTPGLVDLWDVEKRMKLRSLKAGTPLALTLDGRVLATTGNGLELWDVASGKLWRTIKWTGGTVKQLSFDNSGTRLLVSANGEGDAVFDVAAGQRLATLNAAQGAQFSRDGSLVIGSNTKHLAVWNTMDWRQVRDLPNGPDYVTKFAAYPEKDLVLIGGSKSARLLRLSSGEEIAKVGLGYTNFVAFDQNDSLIFTYPSGGFAIWDIAGKQLCGAPDLGNGTVALSANDAWLAAAPVGGGTDVMLWSVQSILRACGLPLTKSSQ
jgi:WD40 repeat protein